LHAQGCKPDQGIDNRQCGFLLLQTPDTFCMNLKLLIILLVISNNQCAIV
jgi:hypothetical protein